MKLKKLLLFVTGLLTFPIISQTAAADIVTSPDFLGFTTPIDIASDIKVAQVHNTGAMVSILNTVLSGPDADQFEIIEDNCTGVDLAFNASCTVSARYIPVSGDASPALAQIGFATLPPNIPSDNVELYGEQIPDAPIIKLNPPNLDFGTVAVGQTSEPQFFEIQNVGVGNLAIADVNLLGDPNSEFQIVDDNCSGLLLAPGDDCFVFVVFAPQSAGSPFDQLVILSNAPAIMPPVGTVAGVADAAVPDISINPVQLDFGNVAVGSTSDPLMVLVKNIGTDDLEITQANVSDPAFTILQDSCTGFTIAPQDFCFLQVRFTPAVEGPTLGAINLVSNDPNPPVIPLIGNGSEAVFTIDPPSPFDFGPVNLNSSKTQVFTLTNNGGNDINVGTITLKGAQANQFSILSDNCSNQVIGVGESCTVEVEFKPIQAGPLAAELNIPSNDPNSPTIHVLQGTGVEAGEGRLNFTPPALDFDEVNIMESNSQELTLTNTGEAPVTIGTVSLGGINPEPFSQSNTCDGVTLNPGESCTIMVQFKAAEAGNFNALVVVTSDLGDGEDTALLFGSTLFVDAEGSGCSLVKTAQSGSSWLFYALLFLPSLAIRMKKRLN